MGIDNLRNEILKMPNMQNLILALVNKCFNTG